MKTGALIRSANVSRFILAAVSAIAVSSAAAQSAAAEDSAVAGERRLAMLAQAEAAAVDETPAEETAAGEAASADADGVADDAGAGSDEGGAGEESVDGEEGVGVEGELAADGELQDGEDAGEATDDAAGDAADTDAADVDAADVDAGSGARDSGARDWGRLQPLANLIEAGGAVIVILVILSVVSLAIVLVKIIQFTLLRPGDHNFIEKASRMLQDGDDEGALDFVSRRRGVVARVMETALRGRQLGADEAQVREEVERVARVKLDGLEKGLPLLSLIATISPLLGLLGTVLGMIEAFQQLENAGDRVDPAILSGGIWEALLTTAAGLSVAIPAAAFFTWLQRSVDVAGQHMENAATRVFTSEIYRTRPAKRAIVTDEAA